MLTYYFPHGCILLVIVVVFIRVNVRIVHLGKERSALFSNGLQKEIQEVSTVFQ